MTKKLKRIDSIIPKIYPNIANMIGIPMSAPNASTVPKPNPDVDIKPDEKTPTVTNKSIINPPTEYKIPQTKPTKVNRMA